MDIDSKRQKILEYAEMYRQAAVIIPKVKEVVRLFDGKLYNCKFDRAIEALSDDTNAFYIHTSYGNFTVYWYSKKFSVSESISILHGRKAEKGKDNTFFDSTKRILADSIINDLNNTYAKLMKDATEFERVADNVESLIAQVKILKDTLNNSYFLN